ncbi:MAG: S1/P1 Nuclease [Caulobacteraceae bacterium]|nr:S1/P1 Nuclease [Caulobacter sp.]
MRRRLAPALLAAGAVLAMAGQAGAWGASGHRWIGVAAMRALPADLPAFLRAPAAAQQVGELAREPDRSKGAGQPHDADSDPGHFLDIDDEGHVFDAQGPAVAALPRTHAEFDAALVKAGIDPGRAGWLPYSIEDGYQQLVKDFSYWRVETALLRRGGLPAAQRAWVAADLQLRQMLTLRDLGVWAHYVGDGSQPLHVSIHYNGWGRDLPDPHGYTLDPIHGPFEGPFVHDNLGQAQVQAAMRPLAACGPTIQACTADYLLKTQASVEPLYQLWGAGGFQPGDPRGEAFALARVAAGADELRDLIVKAWNASASGSVGWPVVTVRDAESGKPVPFEALYGDD